MSRDVTIQILDVISASGSKTIYQNEPFVLRSSGAIRQVKNGTTNLTNATTRVGVCTATVSEGYTDDDDLLIAPTITQLATVEDVQSIYNKVIDASQGFIDVTVKYSMIFNQSGTAPYYVVGHGYPAGTTFVNGDLALAPYDHELLMGQEWFRDAGDRNGVVPIAGTAPLTGENYSLYRYDGTGWLPCVLDTNNGISKYRVKVENDYAYICSLYDTTDIESIPNPNIQHTTNYYEMIYYPNTPSAGITRSVRFPKMFEIEARAIHMSEDLNVAMSNFNCGIAEEN